MAESENTHATDASVALAPRPWMRCFLVTTGACSLFAGAAVLLAPSVVFRLLSAEPDSIGFDLARAIGLLAIAFGVGYLVAARRPFDHWAMVVTGLLATTLVPVWAMSPLSAGRLSWSVACVVLALSLVCWFLFASVLWSATKFHHSRQEYFTVPAPTRKIDPVGRMLSNRGVSLLELSRGRPLLAVFLRHSGCTFCREAVSDIAQQRQQIEALGTQIAFVHMGQQEPVELLKKYNLTDLHTFRDPSCSLYDTFGLKLGTFGQLLGPKVWWKGLLASQRGHKAGAFQGNVFRMPGVFLLHEGTILRAYKHKTAADRPDYVALATPPAAASDASSANAAILN
ncbi:MAG: SelL-related redox protein [Planctomycetaceae bacterium]